MRYNAWPSISILWRRFIELLFDIQWKPVHFYTFFHTDQWESCTKNFLKTNAKKVFRSFKCTLLVLQNMKSEWGRIKCQGFATLPSRQNIKNVWNFSYQSQSMSLTKEISHLFCRVQSLYLYKKLFAHIYTYIY